MTASDLLAGLVWTLLVVLLLGGFIYAVAVGGPGAPEPRGAELPAAKVSRL